MTSVVIPFRYAGGKYYALKLLRPFWQKISHEEYREPFAGGASVFFAKRPAKYNWLNDIDPDLMTTYRVMANPALRMELVKLVSKEVASPERHKEVSELVPKTDLEVAFKYYYLNRTSFSGKMKKPSWGYRPIRSLPPERWHERIIPCGQKLEGVILTNLDFADVISAPKIGSSVLMFIDPPYYKAKQQSHYSYSFEEKTHERLAKVLRKTDHPFFLTYDDCDEVRDLYDWANTHAHEFVYRMDNSRDRGGKRKYGNELVITNYETTSFETIPLTEWIEPEYLEENGSEPPSNYDNESIMSPFRYPGSKGRAAKFIRPYWEKVQHDEYREPFFGGGAIFFAKTKSKHNWINDIDEDLIITLNVLADPELRKELISRVTIEIAAKERHTEMKEWQPTEPLDRAHRYFYLNRTSYSGIMKKPAWGYHTEKSVPPHRWGHRIEQSGQKLEGVRITQLDFKHVIEEDTENKSVFMFVDPPYFAADQKRAYKHSFTEEDHIRLCGILKEMDYKFCLTYDDCPQIIEMYSWAKINKVKWRYHTANARKATRKMGNELIITNY